MLHINDDNIKEFLFRGSFGLEKEGLRVTGEGHPAITEHPIIENDHITMDFSENQTEINTGVYEDAVEALRELDQWERIIHKVLYTQNEREYLWPFSNPPYLSGNREIPIAQFQDNEADKTDYRLHLSRRYGKYMMTYCGIHVNFSFHPELLNREYELSDWPESKQEFLNSFYLDLAQKAMRYAWLVVALTAASPVADSSFIGGEKGVDYFCGLASFRCSELGYWNHFVPAFNYQSIREYVNSIRFFVESGLLNSPAELYYPVRLKPMGKNQLNSFEKTGVNHIEFRMFDINPLSYYGIDKRDLDFVQLFLVWLASLPAIEFDVKQQVNAVQNFKRAAHFDLDNTMLVEGKSIALEGIEVITAMEDFYRSFSTDSLAILSYEKEKLLNPSARYAYQVKERFSKGFVKKGMVHAKKLQNKKLRYEMEFVR